MQIAATACDGKSHSSGMRMAVFSSPYQEVKAFTLSGGARGWQDLFFVATSPATPSSVLTVAEPLVQMMNYAFRCVMGDV